MASTWDRRFGPGWPNCDANHGRVSVRLDFGLGSVFTVEYQSGAVEALLRAVAKVKAINDDLNDGASYKVTVAGTFACRQMRTHPLASLHSLPLAIDVNPQNNSMGGGRGDMPAWFARCFEEEGFTWGLAWGDPMHLENTRWYGEWDGTYPEEDELTKEEKDDLLWLSRFREGIKDYRDGQKAPRRGTPQRFGFEVARQTLGQPAK